MSDELFMNISLFRNPESFIFAPDPTHIFSNVPDARKVRTDSVGRWEPGRSPPIYTISFLDLFIYRDYNTFKRFDVERESITEKQRY